MKYYDKHGQEITSAGFTALLSRFNSEEYKRVAYTVLPGDVQVSTVWLGLDHSLGGAKPLIFETMVFNGPLDGEQDRYSTLEEAKQGHVAMVKKCGGIV